MKTNLASLLPGAIAITLLGCNCRPSGPSSTTPDFVATPTAITFSACPTKDELGRPVPDVFPDVKKLLINNQGRVSGDLGMSLSGPGAEFFTIGTAPASIDRLSEVEVPLSFSPTAKGDVRADLTVDDKTDGTPNPVVTLIGTGINLPAQPTLETAPQKTDKSGFLSCTVDGTISDCTLEFPDTLMDQSSTLQLKLRNRGCPALKVTGILVDGVTTPNTNDGFTLDQPSSPPTTANPILLSTADGTEETTITLRFTATDDGSGISSQSHIAVLSITSNDPLVGDGRGQPALLTIRANAIKPSIYVSPTSCNFTNTMDACGNGTRIANKANFRVTNDGSTPILISSVKFKSSGGTTSSDNRFRVSTNIQGQTLQPATSASIEVTEVDMPLLVSDQLEVVADIPSQGAGSGGSVLLSVISGVKPCLVTEPGDFIDFGDPAEEITARTLVIKNTKPNTNCGTLIIKSVGVSQQPFFSVVDPVIAPDTQIPPGGQLETTVQYRRPSSGGMQLADLQIVTNDTDYGAPQYKLLLLQSNASLDPIPLASLTACKQSDLINDPNCSLGAMNATSFQLSQIDPDEITLSAATSTDNNPLKEYRFVLLPPLPGGATTAALANHNMRIMTNKTKLTIPPGAVGTYRVGLEVWDDRGQKSANTDVMTINIYP